MKSIYLLCLVLKATNALDPVFQILKEDTRSSFVDSEGRRRIFHGVNAVEKLAPYLAEISEDDINLLRSLGLNVIRLGVLWQATYPEKGQLNTTYLNSVRALIDTLGEAGLYVLIDAHQDVLSAQNCGEGIPDWAFAQASEDCEKHEFPAPFPWDMNSTQGIPSLEACQSHSFFDYYLTFENQCAWHGFYTNLSTEFAEHWTAVATALDGSRGLLGYELLNEPFAVLPNLSDSQLDSIYLAAYAAIRRVSPLTPIFFEPLVLDSYEALFKRYESHTKTSLHPLNTTDPNRVFAFHIYCPSNSDGTPAYNHFLCPHLIDTAWQWVPKMQSQLYNTAAFLTEFGAVGDDNSSCDLLSRQLNHADNQLHSWTYWTYRSYDDITTQNSMTETFFAQQDGNFSALQLAKLKVLARPYAPAVAGEIMHMTFIEATSSFFLSFRVTSDLTSLTTVVSLPPLIYPNTSALNISLYPSTWLAKIFTDDYGAVLLHIDPPPSLSGSSLLIGALVNCTIVPT